MTKITPYINNAKEHPEKQIKLIAESIARFGWQQPIKVGKDNVIIVGHGRWFAFEKYATKMNIKEPWIVNEKGETISGCAETRQLTQEEEIAYRLGDNNINAMSNQKLSIVTEELHKISEDLIPVTGYSVDLIVEKEEGDDDVPEVKENVSVFGDVYEIGDHKIICGDSTKLEDLEKLMDGVKADLWITDPPYNVAYEGGTKEKLKIDNDSMSDGNFLQFLTDAFSVAMLNLRAGGGYYIWHADSEGFNFRSALKNCDLKVKQCLIWVKSQLVMGRQDYQWKHEPCLYGWKDGAPHYFVNKRNLTTVIENIQEKNILENLSREELIEFIYNNQDEYTTVLKFDKPSRNGEHPTMKPVELFTYQILNSSKIGEVVLDTFMGSGTTLIACEKTQRKCYGVELDPRYVDVIIQRWVNHTGIENIIKNGKKTIWQKTK